MPGLKSTALLGAIPSPQVLCSPDTDLCEMAEPTSSTAWSVVQTLVRRECHVYRMFTELGWPSYVPTVRRETMHHRQKRVYNDPLFPGYVFVRRAIPWGELVEKRGSEFCRLCRTGHEHAKELSDRLYSVYRTLESGRAFKLTRRPLRGREVEVTRGPLKGVKGRIIRSSGREQRRLLIWIQFLNSGVELDIESGDLACTDI